jgi:hypothetical protein
MNILEKKVNSFGSKVRQRTDSEDRSLIYRNMLYAEKDLWAIDCDLVAEKKVLVDGKYKLRPCAFLELTRIDNYKMPPQSYFDKILARFSERDAQKEMITWIASQCLCDVYIIAFLETLLQFKIYNLSKDNKIWTLQNKEEHIKWHYEIRDLEYNSYYNNYDPFLS